MNKFKLNSELVEECYSLWSNISSMREDRNRNIRYKNGEHWSEKVVDPENPSSLIIEEDLIERDGRIPLKYNFINQFSRNIIGQVIKAPTQSVINTRCRNSQSLGIVLTNTLQASLSENQSKMIDIEVCEELLMTGIAFTKLRYDYNSLKHRSEGIIENTNFDRIFFNNDFTDCRMRNITTIGELHDMTLDDVLVNFAENPQQENKIRKILNEPNSIETDQSANGAKKQFYTSGRKDHYRIIEVWQKMGKWSSIMHDKENGVLLTSSSNSVGRGAGKVYKYYWKVTYLTSEGFVLKEHDTPFAHREHPYSFAVLPFSNGEVRGLISDIIDIQRYINRLIIMLDFIIESSAKGVLMIPESSIPDGYTVDDFTKEYMKTNGVIVYRPSPTREVPYQITSNSTNVGAWEMLSLQMDLIKQISGLSGALQGHVANVQQSGSLYSQQTENSQLNYQTLFEAMRQYKESRDEKFLKVLLQFYKEPRVIWGGNSYDKASEKYFTYNPLDMESLIDFKITISQSVDTPMYRQLYEDVLMGMLQGKYIDIELFLKNSSLPFADQLLGQLEQKKEAIGGEVIGH